MTNPVLLAEPSCIAMSRESKPLKYLVTEEQILNYPHESLFRMDFYPVGGDLVQRSRKIKPNLFLTMGPEGAIMAHPDHSVASIFAMMAFRWAARKDRLSGTVG